ncbi:mannose-6-phosphate isomerase [Coemansia spiralis]|nr:mannose-6-phosphate isomerase [Coemansia spiralis]
MPVVRLACTVNNYHWGKHGLASKAAQFAATNPGVAIDASQTYAELWMGTHPSGPSTVYGTETKLADLIDQDPARLLSPAVERKFGAQLPFLFKVLSIEKALSIQAHPDKQLATQLHAKYPSIYRDPNHKPEMSIALTDFIALSGFRPLEQISGFLDEYPEFRALVAMTAGAFQQAVAENGDKRAALRALFAELMDADAHVQVERLLARTKESADPLDTSAEALAHRLNKEYPGDIGIFCVFVLNVLRLRPGEAFYMGPNDPHAYVFGDCVECMATSDNVVRAGLTPKLRDVPVLTSMLTYEYGSPEGKLLAPTRVGSHSVVYDPPIDEFAVVCTTLRASEEEQLASVQGPQILLVTQGCGVLVADGEHALEPGFVYFISPGTPVALRAASALIAYTALCRA